MMNSADLMRRYMVLFEAAPLDVHVTIGGYVGVSADLLGLPPFPEVLKLTVDASLDRDAATEAIKAEIQAATGYEPARFKWRFAAPAMGSSEDHAPSRRS